MSELSKIEAALDQEAMDDAARRPPAGGPTAADAFAYLANADKWPKVPKATDADISTVAGKVGEIGYYRGMTIHEAVDKVCGLPPFGKIEQKIDLRSEALRQLAEAFSKPSVFSRRFLGHLADDVAKDASRSGLSRELRERAERAAGRVTAVNFTRAAPDEAIVTHLCEIVERLGGTDVAQLDQENARLRRELAEAKRSRDGWQDQARTLMSSTAGLRKRLGDREDNVTRIEPLPDVKPYDDTWPPPAHRPRLAP